MKRARSSSSTSSTAAIAKGMLTRATKRFFRKLPSDVEDPHAPCPLLFSFLSDLRPRLYLALDMHSRSRLACTCKTFFIDMVLKQTAPLYLPSSWRARLKRFDWYCRIAFRQVADDLYRAAFFTGLDGAAAEFNLFGIFGTNPAVWLSKEGVPELKWTFTFVGLYPIASDLRCKTRPALDEAARLACRTALLKVHAEAKEHQRVRRAVSPKLLDELREATEKMRATIDELEGYRKDIRNGDRITRRSGSYYIRYFIRAGKVASEFEAVVANVERLERQVAAAREDIRTGRNNNKKKEEKTPAEEDKEKKEEEEEELFGGIIDAEEVDEKEEEEESDEEEEEEHDDFVY